MTALIGTIIGPLLGGLLGLGTKWLESKEKAADRQHELAVMDKEAGLASARLKLEGELKMEEADANAFAASYKFDNERLTPEGSKLSKGQLWLAIFIDALSKSVRPMSTIVYTGATFTILIWCMVTLNRAGQQGLTQTEMSQLVREVIYAIVYTSETILFWWFGIRGPSRRGQK
jgi:hypothetical protein